MFHRTLVTRIPELLESIKSEYETLAHEANLYKAQRDDYERKLQQQLTEVQNIQATLFELERNHTKIKQQYEEEILRLRRQNEFPANSPTAASFHGGNGPPSASATSGASPGALSLVPSKRLRENDPPAPALTQPSAPVGLGGGYPGALPALNLPLAGGSHEVQPVKQQKTAQTEKTLEVKPPSDSKKSSTGASNLDQDDWTVVYNPTVQTNFNVDLGSTLDHSSVVCCVRFSHDGRYLATGCNRSAQIYDSESGERLHVFSDDNSKEGDLYIRSVCFSPDGKLLAAGAEDKTVKVWDIENKRISHTFIGHDLDIYSLDFTYDGKYIVSGSGDKKAKVWDVEKGTCLFTLGNDDYGPRDGVTSVAISPDGRLIAAGSLDRVVRLWDAQNGYFLDRYEGHLDSVYSVAFSPDGRSLASGSLDKTLKLWDLSGISRTRSRCRSTFTGHKDFVLSVAFSPDGNWLISGSKDRNVQFWDPRTAVTHMMLQGHKNSVISVAVNPQNGSFATGSGDYRARIWRYKPCHPVG